VHHRLPLNFWNRMTVIMSVDTRSIRPSTLRAAAFTNKKVAAPTEIQLRELAGHGKVNAEHGPKGEPIAHGELCAVKVEARVDEAPQMRVQQAEAVPQGLYGDEDVLDPVCPVGVFLQRPLERVLDIVVATSSCGRPIQELCQIRHARRVVGLERLVIKDMAPEELAGQRRVHRPIEAVVAHADAGVAHLLQQGAKLCRCRVQAPRRLARRERPGVAQEGHHDGVATRGRRAQIGFLYEELIPCAAYALRPKRARALDVALLR
jgi:hypothetical protein